MANFEIAALFPTPLLKTEIPPELSTACNLFDKTEMWLDKESRMEYGLHSKNTYIMDGTRVCGFEKVCFELSKRL